MIVAVHYQFHDYEPIMFVIDTNRLDVNEPFQKAIKIQLESKEQFLTVNGEGFDFTLGNQGILNTTLVKPPVEIDAVKSLHVNFE